MNMQSLLEGKRAIISGGTAGIGLAIAKLFIQQGAWVAILGTNPDKGEAAKKELIANSQRPDQVAFYAVDVSKKAEVDQAVQQILDQVNQVDILINNAGITRDQLLIRMSEEDWDRVLEINLKSCYNLSRALMRGMIRARQGKIINVSSIVGLCGNPGQTNYCASKAAMIGFTKSLAQELASRNICVNAIAPGFTDTQMTQELSQAQRDTLLQRIPLGRVGRPEEIAQAVLFLASSMADYITGQVLVVDGGLKM